MPELSGTLIDMVTKVESKFDHLIDYDINQRHDYMLSAEEIYETAVVPFERSLYDK